MLVFNRSSTDHTLDIHFIPIGISDVLPNIIRLFIQFAKLTQLSRKSFRKMSKLRVISLTNNYIEHIDEDTFYEVPELKSLRINVNRLKSIPFNLLIHSVNLQYLVMNKNQIEELNSDIFRHCSLISSINLRDNALQKININLSNYSKLEEIYLENNHCINSSYTSGGGNTLQEIQDEIITNCWTWNYKNVQTLRTKTRVFLTPDGLISAVLCEMSIYQGCYFTNEFDFSTITKTVTRQHCKLYCNYPT